MLLISNPLILILVKLNGKLITKRNLQCIKEYKVGHGARKSDHFAREN